MVWPYSCTRLSYKQLQNLSYTFFKKLLTIQMIHSKFNLVYKIRIRSHIAIVDRIQKR